MDEAIKAEVVQWAAFYEHRLRLGSKPIFHLEGERRCSRLKPTSLTLILHSFLREDHEHLQA